MSYPLLAGEPSLRARRLPWHLAGLAKYVDSRELIVAVHVTKAGRLTLDEIQIPDDSTVRQPGYSAARPQTNLDGSSTAI